MNEKMVFHIIGGDSRLRAGLAHQIFEQGYHAEIYSNVEEILAKPPKSGMLLATQDLVHGRGENLDQVLADAGIWVPFIAMIEAKCVANIVDAMRANAFDCIELPLEMSELGRIIDAYRSDQGRTATMKRRQIDASKRIERLTQRELQVLDGMSNGLQNKRIARALNISARTVEIHRSNMMGKLGTTHSSEAIRLRIEAANGIRGPDLEGIGDEGQFDTVTEDEAAKWLGVEGGAHDR